MHLWDGRIEAHFHFFVMVTLLATYEQWFPYLLAFLYVLVHHGLLGALSANTVFSHHAAIEHPVALGRASTPRSSARWASSTSSPGA